MHCISAGCGDWTCTSDLEVMGLASLLLLHTAKEKGCEEANPVVRITGKARSLFPAAFLIFDYNALSG